MFKRTLTRWGTRRAAARVSAGTTAAPRLVLVGSQIPWKNTDLRPQALREDRILQEIQATGGDVRRICDLFGLTIGAALRYGLTLGHPTWKGRTTQFREPTTPHRLTVCNYPRVPAISASEAGNPRTFYIMRELVSKSCNSPLVTRCRTTKARWPMRQSPSPRGRSGS